MIDFAHPNPHLFICVEESASGSAACRYRTQPILFRILHLTLFWTGSGSLKVGRYLVPVLVQFYLEEKHNVLVRRGISHLTPVIKTKQNSLHLDTEMEILENNFQYNTGLLLKRVNSVRINTKINDDK